MAKSFKENPALQFITKPAESEPPVVESPDTEIRESEKPVSDGTDAKVAAKPIKKKPAAKKKHREKVEYKADPDLIEKRTHRLQLVLQPSLYRRVAAQAKKQKTSVNSYIHELLDNATREE